MPEATEATFLKFVGPMVTYTRGKMRFEKDKIYKVLDQDTAYDLMDTGRFHQVRDPSQQQSPTRRGVRITSGRPAKQEEAPKEENPERGDMSQADLDKGGAMDDRTGGGQLEKSEGVTEARTPEDDYPRLPAQPFYSKKEAVEWAKKNIGVELDDKRSLAELNRRVVEEHTKKYGKKASAEDADDDDDTREENTKVDAITVG